MADQGRQALRAARPGVQGLVDTVAGGKPGVQSTFGTWDSRHRARVGGFFVAKDAPSRVKVHTLNGVTEGTVVKLAGNPGWGAWYADAGISDASQFDPRNNRTFLRGLTVHGTGGKVIAKFEEPKPVLPRTEGTYREVTGTIVNR